MLFGDTSIVPGHSLNSFCNVVNPHSLSLVHTGHTGVTDTTATTTDTMLSSVPDLVADCKIIPPLGSSDHNGLIYGVNLRIEKQPPQHPRKIWQYNHADFDLANDLLSQIDTSSMVSQLGC